MYSFIVLGLIPGTDFQISFQVWLLVLAVSLGAVVCLRTAARRMAALEAVSRAVRQPLAASQLHNRFSS